MRTPVSRSTRRMCSSCCPSSSRKWAALENWSSVGAGAVSANADDLGVPRAEHVVGRLERLVDAGRILPARLREIRPASAAAADQGGDVLDDVAGVETAGDIIKHIAP